MTTTDNELTSLLDGVDLDIVDSTMTRSDLQAQMAKIPNRFSFIKCLEPSDQGTFIDAYIDVINHDETQFQYFEKGVIKVSTWINIMRGLKLQCNYRVYRVAYGGENTGGKVVSQSKAQGYRSMLIEFGSEHIKTIHLLIADRHISRIYLFRRCTFVNTKQWFWDTIMGML